MLDRMIRAALAECAQQREFPVAYGTNVFAWMQNKHKDGL